LLLTAACDSSAPASSPALDLQRAVSRTLADGTARIDARVLVRGHTIRVEGTVSLTDPRALVHASSPANPDLSTEVRVTRDAAWVRAPGASEWVSIDPSSSEFSIGSWPTLFTQLARSDAVTRRGRGYGANAGGVPTTVELDDAGRVARLQFARGGTTIEVRFTDFGVALDVTPPA
jgi:hypothetical protein